MRTEDELSAALRQAATRAPEPDLLAGVSARRRRRARRRAGLLALTAAVAVVVTSTTVARSVLSIRGGEEAAVTVTPGETVTRPSSSAVATIPTAAKPSKPEEIAAAELWPEALFTMPAANPDGWRYRPITGISPTEVLLSAESSFETAGRFEVYDARTGEARVVVDVPVRPGVKKYIPQTTTVDATTVAWYAYGEQADGTKVRDIWTVPLAGGEAKLLTTRVGGEADIDAISLDGEHVVWSEIDGGVWRLPLAGGTPERLPGSDGLHLIEWPWATDMARTPGHLERNQGKLVNLADGSATSLAAPQGTRGLRCGPVWCYGRGERGTWGTVVHRLDGAGTSRSVIANFGMGFSPYPILDRFLQTGSSVYDLETGKLATAGSSSGWYGAGTSSEPSTILYWGTTKADKPDRLWVLNLAAVPPAQ
ncbi:hypothetical protein [Nonomuraea sp. NPDC048916]|uniref:hypothetical protein n=1 Tax=Nonomuraea sp. NPDC048916 TaxID=3154232 RepID=UPI0034101B69